MIIATRGFHSYLNDDLTKALFDGMWGGVLAAFHDGSTASYALRNNRLGDLLNYGKSYLTIGMAGGDNSIQDHFEIYHVIGDPTLELWHDEPILIRVLANILFSCFRPPYLNIKLSSCPKDSVVTIWYQGKKLKRIEPSSPVISCPMKELVIKSQRPTFPVFNRLIEVCFRAPGCRFQRVRVRLR